jgi:pimeloyl-ACP methyl ester carboxylesterase
MQCWNEDNSEQLAFATTANGYRLQGDTDWTRVWTVITVPEGTASLVIRALNHAAPGKGGTAWFDDLELHLVDDALAEGPAALAGAWHGVLQAGGTELNLIFHVDQTDKGWTFTVDSPDQSANGLPVVDVDLRDGVASFQLARIPARFEGRLVADRLEGHWHQGAALPLTLTRLADGEDAPARARPQEPQPPFPYTSEDVSYEVLPSAGGSPHVIHGTLTRPAGDGPHPVVLLISGSGPQDRDETIFGHKPFWVLADHLGRHGLAVLRVDDRGVGKSTGNRTAATSADYAEDVLAGVRYLRTRDDIDPGRIALLGHSEGGLIAPMVAAADPGVAAIVLMAGPGVTGQEILMLQQQLILAASGATPEKLAASQVDQRALLAIATADEDSATRATRMADHLRGVYARLSDQERAEAGPEDAFVRMSSRQMLSSWMRWFLAHDPAPVLGQVRCPVLSVNGSLDVQVDADQNLPAIAAALGAGGNPDHTEVVLEGLNHLMQPAVTGGVEEYVTIEQTLAPAFLDTVTSWLVERLESD